LKQKTAKNVTLYLKLETIKEIERRSKKEKTTKSAIVDMAIAAAKASK